MIILFNICFLYFANHPNVCKFLFIIIKLIIKLLCSHMAPYSYDLYTRMFLSLYYNIQLILKYVLTKNTYT
jgi:hypothetical protein